MTLLLKPIVVVGPCSAVRDARVLASLGQWRTARFPRPRRALRWLGVAAAAALVLQISLGGWTSANYAALACPDFPTCQNQWWLRSPISSGLRAVAGARHRLRGRRPRHPRGSPCTSRTFGRRARSGAHRVARLAAHAGAGDAPGGRASGGASAPLSLGLVSSGSACPWPWPSAHGVAALLLLTVINANQ